MNFAQTLRQRRSAGIPGKRERRHSDEEVLATLRQFMVDCASQGKSSFRWSDIEYCSDDRKIIREVFYDKAFADALCLRLSSEWLLVRRGNNLDGGAYIEVIW